MTPWVYLLVKIGEIRLWWQINPKSQWFDTIKVYFSLMPHVHCRSTKLCSTHRPRLTEALPFRSCIVWNTYLSAREVSQVWLHRKQLRIISVLKGYWEVNSELTSMREREIGWAKRSIELWQGSNKGLGNPTGSSGTEMVVHSCLTLRQGI